MPSLLSAKTKLVMIGLSSLCALQESKHKHLLLFFAQISEVHNSPTPGGWMDGGYQVLLLI